MGAIIGRCSRRLFLSGNSTAKTQDRVFGDRVSVHSNRQHAGSTAEDARVVAGILL
jgi:hypothetical protein